MIVSSDCTGAAPVCAFAFITGAGGLRSLLRLGLLALGLLLLLLLGRARTASASSVCVNAAPDDINANENADAPKTKARECLTPKAICPNLLFCLLVWLAGAAVMRAACWLTIFATGPPARIASALVTPRCGTGQ